MAKVPNFTYIVGADLEDISLWVTANGTLIDLSTNTAEVDVEDAKTGVELFAKATGFVLGAGSGTEVNGSPNCVIQWAADGEITTLNPGLFKATLILTRLDGKIRKRQFLLTILDA